MVGTIAIEIQTYRRAILGNRAASLSSFLKASSPLITYVKSFRNSSEQLDLVGTVTFAWPDAFYIISFYPVRRVHFELYFMNEPCFREVGEVASFDPWEWQSGLSCILPASAQAPSGPLAKLQQRVPWKQQSSPLTVHCFQNDGTH